MTTCKRLTDEVRGSPNFNVSTYLEVDSYRLPCIGLGTIYICDTCNSSVNKA